MRLSSGPFLCACVACVYLAGCSEEKPAAPAAARPARVVVVTPHKLRLRGARRRPHRVALREPGGVRGGRPPHLARCRRRRRGEEGPEARPAQCRRLPEQGDSRRSRPRRGEGSGRAGRAAGGALPHPAREADHDARPSTRMRSRRCRVPKRRSSQPKPIFASRRTS